jgi:DNA polymerase III gamma/tau subunit
VLAQAGARIEDGGLTLIARAAQGGMRDALSLADQCLAFCGDNVTTQNVYDVLGSMEDAFLFEISKYLLASDAPGALKMLDRIMQAGRDLSVFAADLSAHFRALLLAKTCGRCEDLLDCTEDAMTRYLEQAKSASEARLMLALDRLIAAQNDMRYLPSPRALLESALVHICRPEDTLSLANIEARLDRLEAQLKEGIPAQTVKPQASPEPAKQNKTEAPAVQPAHKPEPKPAEAEPAQDTAPWTDLTPPPEEWSPEDEYAMSPQEEIGKVRIPLPRRPHPRRNPRRRRAVPATPPASGARRSRIFPTCLCRRWPEKPSHCILKTTRSRSALPTRRR